MSRDITKCHPRLQKLASELVTACAKVGLMVKITDCYRDAAEQAECVSRGTSNLYYPNSHHNWGTAFDFCRADGKGNGYYNGDKFFERVGAVGKRLGLEWGGDWIKPVDRPHFQLPDWGTSTARLKALYGTPEKFRETWKAEQEDKEVTQEQFNKMMDTYLAERERQPVSDWAKEDWEKAKAGGITDGNMPQAFATREQVISLIRRAVR